MNSFFSTKNNNRGFTMIEFVVILSIFALIATIVLFNFAGFRNNVALNNLAHDVALVIRQSQVYGQSGTGAGSSIQADMRGVHFDSSQNTQMVLFRDTSNNNIYDANEETETITMQSDAFFKDFCVGPDSFSVSCNKNILDIGFIRPDPYPYITEGSNPANTFSQGYAEIIIESQQGSQKTVVVWPTGQISIK